MAQVPPLLLQPLAENAIRHAIAAKIAPGRLDVRVWREGAWLLLAIRDDGGGQPTDMRHGTGLDNIRARLECLYGDEQDLRARGHGRRRHRGAPADSAANGAGAHCGMNHAGQLRAAIVDDEPLARARLRRLLAHEEGVAIVAEFGDGISAAEGLQAIAVDIVFLDVRMPQLDGFAMLQRLPAANVHA